MSYTVAILTGLVVIVLIAFVLYRNLRCQKCGSWESQVRLRTNLEWGTDVGGIMKTDPFFVNTEMRICVGCKDIRVLRRWISPASEDESAFNKIRDEVLSHDFKKDR
ncbi:MAG: hypothetical protein A2648_02300 [Candidatus Lloydbacteria bacterium RIFCSPHIGHO2_01_FULL_41_20]|uniref:Uncharacterized protein n=1 Tax=Candidatus Lloydbacteria bacterium RIFCSPHIGHO2_01_FULL_41_20 TaxID=1798657 RepID=A0A1G2CQW0_9BACT|nr:MAG: hypothetical protein A2648_02300 [Candidatus Lloydbacteria bacterium RIFCSPHIGHO2_01_FULL_41_20]